LTTPPDEFAASSVLGTFVDGEIQFMLERQA
jgi:hypothetical protein